MFCADPAKILRAFASAFVSSPTISFSFSTIPGELDVRQTLSEIRPVQSAGSGWTSRFVELGYIAEACVGYVIEALIGLGCVSMVLFEAMPFAELLDGIAINGLGAIRLGKR